MRICSLCSAELKFINTPLLGSGKLNDGNEICTSCYKKVPGSPSLKKFSLADIQNLLQKKETDAADKKIKAEEKKLNDAIEKAATDNEKMMQKEEKKAEQQEQKKLKEEQKKTEMLAQMEETLREKEEKKARLEEIKEKIKNLKLDNLSSFFGRKEINELPAILAPDEEIDNIIQGVYNNGQGILVSTNRRLVFVDKGLLFGLKVEDFPLDKITTIQYETGLLFGKVKIHTSGNIADIEQVDKSAARKFAEFVRNKQSQPKQPQTVVVQHAAPAQPDILQQLEKLGQLKEKGILSDEEFAAQKKKLLEKL